MKQFSKIGLHLDLRIQVLPIAALRRVAREAAEGGMNTLIVEWEASFPYREHAILSNRYAYTRSEVENFMGDCIAWGLDVIPLQQCFGHVEYILQHRRYAHLRESETDLCQVCPSRIEDAIAVFTEVFRDVAAAHPSPYFHIGGDETYLLGHCPACKTRAKAEGKSRLYVDYFKRAAAEIIKLGKRPLLWIDMLLKHPEAAAEMPSECIFIDWNYGWPVDRFGDFKRLREHSFEFWGAPAMRSAPDNHSSHAWISHFENIRNYIPLARSMDFQGIIMTSWSTSGVYGYEWENVGRALSLYPIRRVMPHSGLKVLTAAFVQAARQEAPLKVNEFVITYAQANFGCSEQDGQRFLEAIKLMDFPPSQVENTRKLHGKARMAQRMLLLISIWKNEREFARYKLMADLLEYHLRTVLLDDLMQAAEFTISRLPHLRNKAAKLREEGEILNLRYAELYKGELYPAELLEEIDYRLKGIREMDGRLNRAGRSTSHAAAKNLPLEEIFSTKSATITPVAAVRQRETEKLVGNNPR